MKLNLALAGLATLAVAGCATQSDQERCIDSATRDYRALNDAIFTTEGNLGRGYAVHKQSVPYTYQGSCWSYEEEKYYDCPRTRYRTEETPVQIDTRHEKERLAELKARLPETRKRADEGVRTCRAAYPDA